MKSLKSYAPWLAQLFETTPDAIYERQRALSRAGLLDEIEGRGPGSGARATAKSLATLIIALAAADELRDIDTHVRKVLKLKGNLKRYKDDVTFLDAITWLLSDPSRCERISYVKVSRTALSAEISGEKFGSDRGKMFFMVDAVLESPIFSETARAFRRDSKSLPIAGYDIEEDK